MSLKAFASVFRSCLPPLLIQSQSEVFKRRLLHSLYRCQKYLAHSQTDSLTPHSIHPHVVPFQSFLYDYGVLLAQLCDLPKYTAAQWGGWMIEDGGVYEHLASLLRICDNVKLIQYIK